MCKLIVLTCLFASVMPAQDHAGTTQPLWAGMSVSEPVAIEGSTAHIELYFAIVNDGNEPIDANELFALSDLSINGVPFGGWRITAGNGPRSAGPLQPGDALRLNFELGKYFEKPGVYTVSWSGPGYKASDITFRVLAKVAR
jgi:hypothetical protein